LNDNLYERPLKHDDWIRLTRSPGGKNRDADADARQQYHSAEGEKNVSEAI
jgi:hypothetical protein